MKDTSWPSLIFFLLLMGAFRSCTHQTSYNPPSYSETNRDWAPEQQELGRPAKIDPSW